MDAKTRTVGYATHAFRHSITRCSVRLEMEHLVTSSLSKKLMLCRAASQGDRGRQGGHIVNTKGKCRTADSSGTLPVQLFRDDAVGCVGVASRGAAVIAAQLCAPRSDRGSGLGSGARPCIACCTCRRMRPGRLGQLQIQQLRRPQSQYCNVYGLACDNALSGTH